MRGIRIGMAGAAVLLAAAQVASACTARSVIDQARGSRDKDFYEVARDVVTNELVPDTGWTHPDATEAAIGTLITESMSKEGHLLYTPDHLNNLATYSAGVALLDKAADWPATPSHPIGPTVRDHATFHGDQLQDAGGAANLFAPPPRPVVTPPASTPPVVGPTPAPSPVPTPVVRPAPAPSPVEGPAPLPSIDHAG